MPKSLLIDPSLERSKMLFGSGAMAANMSAVARETKIPQATLSRYKQRPDTIPLRALRRIVKARRLDDEAILRIVRGRD